MRLLVALIPVLIVGLLAALMLRERDPAQRARVAATLGFGLTIAFTGLVLPSWPARRSPTQVGGAVSAWSPCG